MTGKVRGVLYNGPIDCLWKTFKAEGIAGWYKGRLNSGVALQNLADIVGTTAHFFRIFPHTVVTLVANEVSSPFRVYWGFANYGSSSWRNTVRSEEMIQAKQFRKHKHHDMYASESDITTFVTGYELEIGAWPKFEMSVDLLH